MNGVSMQNQLTSLSIPTKVLNLPSICHSLQMSHLSQEGVLSMAHDAMCNGRRQVVQSNQGTFVLLEHNQMMFTISGDCTSVISIQYLGGERVHSVNPMQTNQHSLYNSCAQSQHTTPTPGTCPDSSSILSVHGKSLKEGTPEYDLTINQMVDSIPDMDEIAEMDQFITENEPSSSLLSLSRHSSLTSCYGDGSYRATPLPVTPSSSTSMSFSGVTTGNGITRLSSLAMGQPSPLQTVQSMEELTFSPQTFTLPQMALASSLTSHSPIQVSPELFQELCSRFGHFGWTSSIRQLTQHVSSVMRIVPMNQVQYMWNGQMLRWKCWTSGHYTFVMDHDAVTLVDIFESRHFHHQYQSCLQQLLNRHLHKMRMTTPTPPTTTIPTYSMSTSSGSSTNNNNSRSYHMIYIKPIMERLAKMARPGVTIDERYVTEIVDNAIHYGVKRQISKRTFEFKTKQYTVIMSKSLRTILDVAIADGVNGVHSEVVTVHPDVVSILAKKCPTLDYFQIQGLAYNAKKTGRFSAKKNEYRKQFTYEHAGCRIVFASNHSTIVEMQCCDPSALQLRLSALITFQ